MVFEDWSNGVRESWENISERFINFVPNLIGAIIILVIGWLAGLLISVVIDRVFRLVGLQTLFEKAKIDDTLKKANIDKDTTSLLAAVAKWIIFFVNTFNHSESKNGR